MQNLKDGKNIQPRAGIYPDIEFPIILSIKLFSNSANKLCFNFFVRLRNIKSFSPLKTELENSACSPTFFSKKI